MAANGVGWMWRVVDGMVVGRFVIRPPYGSPGEPWGGRIAAFRWEVHARVHTQGQEDHKASQVQFTPSYIPHCMQAQPVLNIHEIWAG